jgi:hypothetical protein
MCLTSSPLNTPIEWKRMSEERYVWVGRWVGREECTLTKLLDPNTVVIEVEFIHEVINIRMAALRGREAAATITNAEQQQQYAIAY